MSAIQAVNERYPAVSVIIPVTRRDLLPWVLQSLRTQSYDGTFEIIVVGTFADEFAGQWPIIPLNVPQLLAPGKARNLGAARASGTILIFLDDDCAVPSTWIAQNVRALQQEQIGAVGARMPGKARGFFARCTDFASFGDFQNKRVKDIPLAAASMAVWRSLFELAGGFDTSMLPGEEEDTDLCYRIQKLHYRTVYQPDVVVIHDHRRDTPGKLLRHTYRQGLRRGLATKLAHRELRVRNRLLGGVRFPPFFFLCLPLIALAATLRIVALNVRAHKKVVFYSPVIFLSKVTYNYGIFMHLLQASRRGKKQ
jgi:glycosyltransferase involved in cell wall biosynthesis